MILVSLYLILSIFLAYFLGRAQSCCSLDYLIRWFVCFYYVCLVVPFLIEFSVSGFIMWHYVSLGLAVFGASLELFIGLACVCSPFLLLVVVS